MHRSRDSLVGVVTDLRVGRPRNRGLIPGRDKRLCDCTRTSRPALGPTQPRIEWGLESVARAWSCLLPPSVAEVKNVGVIPVLRHRPSRCSQETSVLLPAGQSNLPFSICCILLCAVFSYCRYKVHFFLQHVLRTQRESISVTTPNLNLGVRWE